MGCGNTNVMFILLFAYISIHTMTSYIRTCLLVGLVAYNAHRPPIEPGKPHYYVPGIVWHYLKEVTLVHNLHNDNTRMNGTRFQRASVSSLTRDSLALACVISVHVNFNAMIHYASLLRETKLHCAVANVWV